jgi:hypothetical protein
MLTEILSKSLSGFSANEGLIKPRKKRNGFSPEDETRFLGRIESEFRITNLNLELSTQLSEDFGLVEFSKEYICRNEQITDPASGLGVVELTSRGGVLEETEAIKRIEEGLLRENQQTMVHFSPKNEELGYDQNCVDFWRKENGKIIWNRLAVNDGFEEMKKIYELMSGDKVVDEMELLTKPISSSLKLSELFSLFRMTDKKKDVTYEEIEKTVKEISWEFEKQFGKKLTEDKDLILRLYSAAYDRMSDLGRVFDKIERRGENRMKTNLTNELYNYMFAPMTGVREEVSSGCAGSTIVGSFGEKYGYYVIDGQVSFGLIPEGMKLCKQCGCYFSGNNCPFCP